MADTENITGTATDPISWWGIAAKSIAELFQKIIPPDEIRLARYKKRGDIRYAKLRTKMEEYAEHRIIHNNGKHPTIRQVDDMVNSLYPKMAYTEREDMLCIVREKFGLSL